EALDSGGGARRNTETIAKDFHLFLAGRFFAGLALQMQAVAIGWYLYDLTGEAMVLAYAGLSIFIPIALFTLPGGDVADRYDRRRILAATHLVQALCAGILVVLAAGHNVHPGAFYAVLALSGTARAFSGPAVPSFLPFLVPRERFPSAVAVSSSV